MLCAVVCCPPVCFVRGRTCFDKSESKIRTLHYVYERGLVCGGGGVLNGSDRLVGVVRREKRMMMVVLFLGGGLPSTSQPATRALSGPSSVSWRPSNVQSIHCCLICARPNWLGCKKALRPFVINPVSSLIPSRTATGGRKFQPFCHPRGLLALASHPPAHSQTTATTARTQSNRQAACPTRVAAASTARPAGTRWPRTTSRATCPTRRPRAPSRRPSTCRTTPTASWWTTCPR